MTINIYYINHSYSKNNKINYFSINDVYGYFEKNDDKKYFNFDNTHNNKKFLQKYMLLWDNIKNMIRDKGGKPPSDFVIDNMTFKLDTDYYLQVYLEKCKYKND